MLGCLASRNVESGALAALILVRALLGAAAVTASGQARFDSLGAAFRPVSRVALQEEPGFVLGSLSDVQVDSAGNIVVGDWFGPYVYIFDSDGRRLRKIGKKGKGPGEFSSVWSVSIGPRAELLVTDTALGRITIFDTAGNYMDSFVTTRDGIAPQRAYMLRDGRVLVTGDKWTEAKGPERRIQYLHMYSQDFELQRSWCFASPLLHERNLYSERGVHIAVDEGKGLLYCAEAIGYRVRVYTMEGQLLRTLDQRPWFYKEPPEFQPKSGSDDEFRQWLASWTLLYRVVLADDSTLLRAYRLGGSEEDYAICLQALPKGSIVATLRTAKRFLCKGRDGYFYFLESMPPRGWVFGRYVRRVAH